MIELVEALREIEPELEISRLQEDHPCEGSKFHSPTPLVVNPIDLDSFVEWTIEDLPDLVLPSRTSTWLCGTCQGNLSIFAILMKHYEGAMPWPIQRKFGNLIRALGQRAWTHYSEREAHG